MNIVTCKAYELHDYTEGLDLESDWAEGFTVGKGKVMYWYFIWHSTGNCTVYTPEVPARKRFISGDQLITIHFKEDFNIEEGINSKRYL